MSARRPQQGFTIVELLVTLMLTVILSTAMAVFVVSGLRTYATAAVKADLLSQAQTASDRIAGDIMLSASSDLNNRIDDANAPNSGNPNSWLSDGDTLILASAVENTSGNIVYADPSNYVSYKNNIIYYISNKTLYRRVLAANVSGNKAKTTCPPASATPSCPADGVVLTDVLSISFSYRNHLDQTVVPDEARSVEVGVVLQRKNDARTKVSYISRTVFRNE